MYYAYEWRTREYVKNPTYHDVVEEVASYLDKQAKELIDRGLPRELILIDPWNRLR